MGRKGGYPEDCLDLFSSLHFQQHSFFFFFFFFSIWPPFFISLKQTEATRRNVFRLPHDKPANCWHRLIPLSRRRKCLAHLISPPHTPCKVDVLPVICSRAASLYSPLSLWNHQLASLCWIILISVNPWPLVSPR